MENKVAMVTGASRGIGRATALAFARQGYSLILAGRTHKGSGVEHRLFNADGEPLAGSLDSVAQEVRVLGRPVECVHLDLLDCGAIEQTVERALACFGRIDVLVNNAVYQGADLNASLDELSVDTLQRVAQAYLISPWLLTRGITRNMAEKGGGVVINVTSGAGESNPPISASRGGWGYAYAAGKAAVSRLSGIVKAELGDQGIRAYTLNPGVVTTEALRATIGEAGVQALGAGSAPPQVPALVMLWLADNDLEGTYQKRTVHAQSFAKERQLLSVDLVQSGDEGAPH